MSSSNKNIDLTGTHLPERLQYFREQRNLTKSELARESGLTARTIHDLEQGRRERALERTLMALAQALAVTVAQLLDRDGDESSPATPTTTPRRSAPGRSALTFLSVLVVVLVFAFGYLWSFARDNAEWTQEQNRLTVVDSVFGIELWNLASEAHISFCVPSPWGSDRLLVGLGSQTPDGGCLLNLDRATGDTIWCARPDIPAIVRAFGEEDVLDANFNCREVQPADLDGDGHPELVAHFVHGRYYPYALCAFDEDGNLLRQYANKGHVDDSLVLDLDGDGRDELLASGTNNAKAYQGATVFILDLDHWRGASVDSLCNPESSEPDSARIRLVIPRFPEHYMLLLEQTRLYAMNLNVYHDAAGDAVISAGIGAPSRTSLIVYLDGELRPRGCEPTDGFARIQLSQWPRSLTEGTGPGDPVWRAEWLAQHKRFGAGHWPPAGH